MSNNDAENPRPAVMGASIDSIASTYPQRDSVGFYADNNLIFYQKRYEKDDVSFSTDGVTIKNFDSADVLPGMLVDAADKLKTNDSWYVGIITKVESNKIYVSNWYQQRDDGSIKTGTPANVGVYINLCTRVWGGNINVFTNERSCTGLEIGVSNKSDTVYADVAGVDVVTLAGRGQYAYKARKNFDVGYYANTRTAFDGSDASEYAFKSKQTKVNASGKIENLAMALTVVSANANLNMANCIFLITGGTTFNISGSPIAGNVIIVNNRTSATITVASKSIAASTTKLMVYDGNNWLTV